jgi:hypothetical protein
MAKSTIWISYDLGVRGDYEGLYSWLDSHGARECGDSLAVLSYEHDRPLLQQLKADISQQVSADNRTRIYVIYKDARSNKNKGKFIFGRRRAAPWTGFSPAEYDAVDEEL